MAKKKKKVAKRTIKKSNGVEPVIATKQLCNLMGFYVSQEFLQRFKITPIMTDTNGAYWRKSDLPKIFRAIGNHCLKMAREQI
ncbi:MAG TPA: hypothetical protein VH593_19665 [Ktedonobacteraceae bacterium]|jgi:hypothetical protein